MFEIKKKGRKTIFLPKAFWEGRSMVILESGESGESGDSGDSGDSGESGDAGESGNSGDAQMNTYFPPGSSLNSIVPIFNYHENYMLNTMMVSMFI